MAQRNTQGWFAAGGNTRVSPCEADAALQSEPSQGLWLGAVHI